MITVKDIAAATGVSATTVSNVINGRDGRVSQETIAKINAAIEELGYVPNMSAKSLVSRQSKVIGFINHTIIHKNSNFMEDPFTAKFVGILERELRENGYYLMLRTVETPEEFNAFIRTWAIDGLFLSGIFEDSFYEAIKPSLEKYPTVLVDSFVHSPKICNVGLEDFRGGYLSTQYLINRGHKRIAFASFHIKDGGVLMERYLGYKAALTESAIAFDESIIFECGTDKEHLMHVVRAVENDPSITAIVTASDFMAANLMSLMYQSGISIPDDISIMGFDDLNICNITCPPLSTIHQDMELKGKTAVDYMLELLSGNTPEQTDTYLPVSVVERSSVKDA